MTVSRLLYNFWERENRYIYSSVNDFHHHNVSQRNVTGLKYVISGTEHYRVRHKNYSVGPNCCLLVNKTEVFDIHVQKEQFHTDGICISLDDKLIHDIFINSTLSHESLADRGSGSSESEFLFYETIYNGNDILSRHLEFLTNYLNTETGYIALPQEELFYGIATQLLLSQSVISKEAFRIKAIRYNTRMELYKRISLAKQKLEDEPEQNTSMAELAAMSCMSEFHFFRIFRQAMGVSPNQYRLKFRLKKAISMITTTRLSLHEIAVATGFSDVYAFSKWFKKVTGTSPGKYRVKIEE